MRALSKAITLVETGGAEGHALLQSVRAGLQNVQRPTVLGLTGSPGSGKSTLVAVLISVLRSQGKTVGVLAVDPSSPFSGGAILGDRIRMLGHHADPPMTKDAVAGRIRRLLAMADKRASDLGIPGTDANLPPGFEDE